MTAKTLGLDTKHELVYHVLEEICDGVGSDALDFEGFVRELTAKIVQYNLKIGKSIQRVGKEVELPPHGHSREGRIELGGYETHKRVVGIWVLR